MRQKSKPAARGGLPGHYSLLLVLAVLGSVAIAYFLIARRPSGGTVTRLVDAASIPRDPQALILLANGIDLGSPDAPIRMLSFVDFQCPGCRWFATDIEPLLRENYVNTGKVRLTHYDYPLVSIHRHAFVTARAARCAHDQSRFWDYHDLLFARQSSWTNLNSITGTLTNYAQELGLDPGAFSRCLESDQHAEAVTASYHLGEQLGVVSTPTVFMNGRTLPLVEWAEFRALLDAELTSDAP